MPTSPSCSPAMGTVLLEPQLQPGCLWHLEISPPPAFCHSSWDICGAVCRTGAAQTQQAAGWERHGAAKD